MAEVDPQKPAKKRRGGLGRGLGALIPDGPEAPAVPESPLDVIFPERSRSGVGGSQRGGSMRELLGPPGPRNVSRETRTSRRSSGLQNADVSRETSSGPESGTELQGGVSRETLAPLEEPTHGIWGNGQERAVRDEDVSRETNPQHGLLTPVPGANFASVPLDWIVPNLEQPRNVFEEAELDELADSIRTLGVLQPVVVRPLTEEILSDPQQKQRLLEEAEERPNARYELVMGERRWRAAAAAGLETVPAIVRATDTGRMLREALVENLHRVQLNPLEEAAAYNQLLEDFEYTQEELSQAVAKSRPQVANTLRLLKLPVSVQDKVAADVLSAGHARALLRLKDPEAMDALAERIIKEGLSVRSTEELVRAHSGAKPKRTAKRPSASIEAQGLARQIAEGLETTVKVTQGKTRGRLVVEFADEADLQRIAQIIGARNRD